MPRIQEGFQRPTQKPLFSTVKIDFSHPLAKGLIGGWLFRGSRHLEGSFTTEPDVVRSVNNLLWSNTGTQNNAVISGMLGINFPDGHLTLAAPTSILKPSAEVSLFWKGAVLGGGSISNNPAIAAMYHNSSNSAPYVSYGLHRISGDASGVYLLWNNGSIQSITMGGTIDTGAYGTPFNLGFSIKTGDQKVYKNGLQIGTASVAGTITYDATAPFYLNGSVAATGNNSQSFVDIVWIWDRYLTASEHQLINKNPWIFLKTGKAIGRSVVVELLNIDKWNFDLPQPWHQPLEIADY